MMKKNTEYLEKCPFSSLLTGGRVRVIDGEMISYLNLSIDEITGEILEITPENKVVFQEKAVSTPLRLGQKGWEDPSFTLSLAIEEDLPEPARDVVKSSLSEWNRSHHR